jgi:hypothetical protein
LIALSIGRWPLDPEANVETKCSYGFGDPGVNLRLEQWTRNLPGKNTLVILTPDKPDAYIQTKPIWMQQLMATGRVKFVDKFLQDCTTGHIEKHFDD